MNNSNENKVGYLPIVNPFEKDWFILNYVDENPFDSIEVAIDYLDRNIPGIVYNHKTNHGAMNEFKHIYGGLLQVNTEEIQEIRNQLALFFREAKILGEQSGEINLRFIPTLTVINNIKGVSIYRWLTNPSPSNFNQQQKIHPMRMMYPKDTTKFAEVITKFNNNK